MTSNIELLFPGSKLIKTAICKFLLTYFKSCLNYYVPKHTSNRNLRNSLVCKNVQDVQRNYRKFILAILLNIKHPIFNINNIFLK